MQEEIGYRTMLLPNSGFAKKVTRPVVVNTMPGTQLTNIRKLVRTTTSSNPAHRPTMAEIAPQILAVASAVRLAMQQNVTPVASAAAAAAAVSAALPSGDVDEVQPSAHASTGSAVAVQAGAVDAPGLLGVNASAEVPLAPIFHGDALLAGGGGGGSSGRGDGGGGGASAAGAPAVGSGVGDRLGGGDSNGGGRSAASVAVPRHMSAEVQEALGAAEGRGAEGISGGGGRGGSEASGRAGDRAGGDAVEEKGQAWDSRGLMVGMEPSTALPPNGATLRLRTDTWEGSCRAPPAMGMGPGCSRAQPPRWLMPSSRRWVRPTFRFLPYRPRRVLQQEEEQRARWARTSVRSQLAPSLRQLQYRRAATVQAFLPSLPSKASATRKGSPAMGPVTEQAVDWLTRGW
ncbi:unnamed protein product [Ectocarpus sp. 13 AM-2016]